MTKRGPVDLSPSPFGPKVLTDHKCTHFCSHGLDDEPNFGRNQHAIGLKAQISKPIRQIVLSGW
jgi:hypothetical protein